MIASRYIIIRLPFFKHVEKLDFNVLDTRSCITFEHTQRIRLESLRRKVVTLTIQDPNIR